MMRASIFLVLIHLSLLGYGQKLSVYDLKTNYKTNPVVIETDPPKLSWKLKTTADQVMQRSFEIRVAKTREDLSAGKNLLWESGEVRSDRSVHNEYKGPALQPRQRYYWQVRVSDNQKNTSPWSEIGFWETGLRPGDWIAKFIQPARQTEGKVCPAPMFRTAFKLDKPVRQARLYITSHGLYEAELNGKRVGDEYFTPGWTSYHKRLQYQTYDVTAHLKSGQNTALVTVGDGWYRGNLEFNNKRNLYGKEVGLLFQMEIEYADGTRQIVASDDTWLVSFDGPVRKSDIYNGETYDLRIRNALAGGGLKAGSWEKARVADFNYSKLVVPLAPRVMKHERFRPVKLIRTPKGETVADFGQNLVGWVQLSLKGTAGDTVTLHHAEVLDKDGNFYTDNLRNAKQENKYILTGQSDLIEPHFTFQGFRYVRISGYKGKLDNNAFTAIAIYSEMKSTGTFSSSHPLVNQLQHNIQWGQRGNFLDVPTDCPQRDERLGWTGDAQVFFNTAAYNMDVAGFFSKWLADLNVDQHEDGNIPVVIPDVRKKSNAGSAGWGDVATIIPWQYYQAYGDKALLSRQYKSMKEWVDHLRGISKNNLWNSGWHYGDWLFYTMADDRDGKAAITDKFLIAQAFYAHSVQNLINAASVLGFEDDVKEYSRLLKDVKDAFMFEYVTPSGKLVSNSQTAYVLALQFDLLPQELRAQAAARLAENIKSYKNHLTTGFLGTPYLCHVLTRFGYNDLAYALLLQETYPSWLYPVKMGATTIWERWDGIKPDGSFQEISMNSFNHYAYGAIGDWMYRAVAGINSNVSSPGYKKMIVAPKPSAGLSHAHAELETLYGKVSSSWRRENGTMTYNITIPPNTTAKIILHAGSASIKSGNLDIAKVKSIKNIVKNGEDTEFETGSGTYQFVCAQN